MFRLVTPGSLDSRSITWGLYLSVLNSSMMSTPRVAAWAASGWSRPFFSSSKSSADAWGLGLHKILTKPTQAYTNCIERLWLQPTNNYRTAPEPPLKTGWTPRRVFANFLSLKSKSPEAGANLTWLDPELASGLHTSGANEPTQKSGFLPAPATLLLLNVGLDHNSSGRDLKSISQ